jgi:type I restriction enzyme R subunit
MSPTDFIQIKGRGTRLFTFKHQDGENEQIDKDGFGLFDFFANCEYFEEDFDYDQKLIPPREPAPPGPNGGGGGAGVRIDSLTNTSPDPIRTIEDQTVGKWGMRIDREMYRDRFAQKASEAAESDSTLREAVESEDWTIVERRIRELLTDRAETEWDITELQKVYQTDRTPTLKEILQKIFGVIQVIPTREQLADQAYERFIATQNANAIHSRELRTVFVAFLLDPTSRQLLELGRFPELRARDPNLHAALSALPATERDALVVYLKTEVSLKDFEKAA